MIHIYLYFSYNIIQIYVYIINIYIKNSDKFLINYIFQKNNKFSFIYISLYISLY